MRLELLAEVLDDVEAMLQFRLATHGVDDAEAGTDSRPGDGRCAIKGAVATQDAPNSDSQAERGRPGRRHHQLVKDYARQETVGPLRGAARWLGYGVGGAVCLGFGAALVVLGVLRLLQNEFADTFDGRWMSLLPYLIALVLSLAIIGLAVSRIMKTSLHRRPTDRTDRNAAPLRSSGDTHGPATHHP